MTKYAKAEPSEKRPSGRSEGSLNGMFGGASGAALR